MMKSLSLSNNLVFAKFIFEFPKQILHKLLQSRAESVIIYIVIF